MAATTNNPNRKRPGKSAIRDRAFEDLTSRIGKLSPDELNDIVDLAVALRSTTDPEEIQSIKVAFREILDHQPLTATADPLKDKPTAGKKKWAVFVGKKVKAIRKEVGMTQTELAKRSGIPQSHVSRIENGEHSPSHKTVAKLAKALGVKIGKIDPNFSLRD